MSKIIIPVRPRCVIGRVDPIAPFGARGRFTKIGRLVQAVSAFSRWPSDDEVADMVKRAPAHYSKSNSWETGLLALLFNNTNFANVGDATGLRGSTTAGNLYLSLHTADPGEAGDQTTSEIAYTSYARKAVARASGAGGWTVSGNSASLTDAITSFVAGTGGSGTATFFGVGTAASGAGVLLYSGTVTPNIICGVGVTPQLSSATAITED